ncbi:MAG: ArsR family transcriptional regulator [Thermoplasmatota archaeon]
MRRIKVISEPSDLVPILRSFDTDVKRDVFQRLVDGWITPSQIEAQFGPAGIESLRLFEKSKLVETRWEILKPGTTPEKAYHSYYTSFQLNLSSPVGEISEILAIAAMPDAEFSRIEDELVALAGKEGWSARTATEKLGIPLVRLRALLKRSSRLELKGHMVVPIE